MSVLSKWFGVRGLEASARAAARELMRSGAVLVDVREKGEWDAGHAPKAKHHPLRRSPGLDEPLAGGSHAGRGVPLWQPLGAGHQDAGQSRVRRPEPHGRHDGLRGLPGLPMVNSRGKKGSVR